MYDQAVEDLVTENVGLARYAARKMSKQLRITYDEAYSDALVGLWQAAQRYDPDRGVKFSTFAAKRINGEIVDRYRSWDHCEPARVNRLRFVSLDDSYIETVADPVDPLAEMFADAGYEEILATTSSMSARTQDIVRRHAAGETLLEIARDHGIGESRVCQIWRSWAKSWPVQRLLRERSTQAA